MKYAVVLCALLFGAMHLSAQEKAVPKNVMKAFKSEFKSSESPSWYVEQSYYEVQFLQDRLEKIAHFSKVDGSLIEVRELIDENDIPSKVIQTLRKEYPEFVFQEFSRIVVKEKEPVYSINVEVSEKILALDISPEGTLLKTEEITR